MAGEGSHGGSELINLRSSHLRADGPLDPLGRGFKVQKEASVIAATANKPHEASDSAPITRSAGPGASRTSALPVGLLVKKCSRARLRSNIALSGASLRGA